jgi:ABC-type multidrug transport system ATPase subunit
MIEIKHLTKRFGSFCAVEDVCLQVQPGEIFAILGPNGSGKTTTLKCVAGLVSPSAGQVLINGVDSWENAVEAKRLFSYLPQRVAFPELLTAREILEFYCRLRKLPLERAAQALSSSRLMGLGRSRSRSFPAGWCSAWA